MPNKFFRPNETYRYFSRARQKSTRIWPVRTSVSRRRPAFATSVQTATGSRQLAISEEDDAKSTCEMSIENIRDGTIQIKIEFELAGEKYIGIET